MLPSYIEDDVKAQKTNDNELHDQYCLVFMSHLPFIEDLVMILFGVGLSAGIA